MNTFDPFKTESMSIVLIILSCGLAAFVFRRLMEIRSHYQCPNPDKIQDYFEGRLKKRDKEGYDHLITHLGVCEKCQNTLSNMVGDSPRSNAIEDHLIEGQE